MPPDRANKGPRLGEHEGEQIIDAKHPTDRPSGSQLAAAQALLARGFAVVPVPHKSKAPKLRGWQRLRITAEQLPRYFNGDPQNLAVLLGEPSGGVIDIDLDCRESVALAEEILPATNTVFGRRSNPKSHYLYRCTPIPKTTAFTDIDGQKLIELRCTGAQTVFPPSTHPSGEVIAWHTDGEAAEIGADELLRRIKQLAAATILVRHWPVGSRHTAALALAGGLLQSGWPVESVERFIETVCLAADDEEVIDRCRAARDTASRIECDEGVTSWKQLAEIISDTVVHKVRSWLGVHVTTRQVEADDRPEIILSTDEHRCVEQAVEALTHDKNVFQRGGVLVRAVRDTQPTDGVVRTAGSMTVQRLPAPNLRERLTRCARFRRIECRSDSERILPAHPAP